MATKSFAYYTEPHTATLGEGDGAVVLKFHPEVDAGEFLSAQEGIREVQALAEKYKDAGDDPDAVNVQDAAKMVKSTKDFIATFMLPESREQFEKMAVPMRILQGLSEFVMEIYGQRPTGSSSGSRPQPQPDGTHSTDN